jgi:uncharacterized glyoxalase superfamily protein PhnB
VTLVPSDGTDLQAWLGAAFGFVERVRIAEDRRSQLSCGDAAVIVGDGRGDRRPPRDREATHSVRGRVDDVDAHYERAGARGARILIEPTDIPHGERQYEAEDLAGHQLPFSERLADVAPDEWGGISSDSCGWLGPRSTGARRPSLT